LADETQVDAFLQSQKKSRFYTKFQFIIEKIRIQEVAVIWSLVGIWSNYPRPRPMCTHGHPVAYVHCVMHKCIMVKVGGNKNHKVGLCKKNVTKLGRKFPKVGEEEIFRNRGK